MAAKLKPSIVAVYVSVFALVVVMVAIGYHEPQRSSVVANATTVSTPSDSDKGLVDEVVAASLAASAAKAANLPIAPSVASLAISTQTENSFTQAGGASAAKPQLIGSDGVRSVTKYKVKNGDTVDKLAAQFDISAQTIKWANNLTTNSLAVGSTLDIPPVDSVIYTVKSGDTVNSIAKRYSVDRERLVLFNDLDLGGLTPGREIVLPGASLPTNERPGYVAPVVATANYYYSGVGAGFGGSTWHIRVGTPGYAGNTYAFGNCTKYAFDRRVQLGLPVSASWGNASSWATLAAAGGLTVNNRPSVGAIMQNGGGFGHVAIVEKIMPNGDIQVSEMNAYVAGGGFNIVSGRTVLAGNVSSYLYIH